MQIFGPYLIYARTDSWQYWPFGEGFTGGWLLTLSKFVFIGVILALIMGFLRFLFGPGGPLRDKEMDREAEEERKRIQEAVDILRKRLARGEITEEEFERKKWYLER
ncbi:SHOCT domain-containing protein [Desulfovulcanus sp.]